MSPSAAFDLHELTEFLRAEFKMKTMVLTGGSMGGTGGLIYCVLHPEDLDGAVIFGGSADIFAYYEFVMSRQSDPLFQEILSAMTQSYGGTPETIPDVYARHCAARNADKLTMPLHAAHGEADPVIPAAQIRCLAEKMKGKANFRYHEIPGGDHDSPIFDKSGFEFIYDQTLGLNK